MTKWLDSRSQTPNNPIVPPIGKPERPDQILSLSPQNARRLGGQTPKLKKLIQRSVTRNHIVPL